MFFRTGSSSKLRLALLFALLVLALAGCGEATQLVHSDAGPDSDDAPAEKSVGDEYVERQQNIIMPWTYQVDEQLLSEMVVEADRLVAPLGSAAADYERGDVLVSIVEEQPFLRKITEVDVSDGEVIYLTRDAAITEAVYKGSLTPTPQERMADGSDGFDQREQQLGDKTPDYLIDSTYEYGKAVEKEWKGVKFTAHPSVDINAKFYLDMKLDATGNSTRHTHFVGSLQCNRPADCFPNAARGEDRAVECNRSSGVCEFNTTKSNGWLRADGDSCNDIIGALDFAESHSECRELFDQYYSGDISLKEISDSKSGWFTHTCKSHLPPHPVQIDWAKDNCGGALKRLVVDGEGSILPTTGELNLGMKKDFNKTWNLWDSGKHQIARKVFFIGWFPVLITSNVSGKLDLSLTASIEAEAKVDPITIEGLRFGTGFHYYDTPGDDDGVGVIGTDGSFQKFSDSYGEGKSQYGNWHLNPTRTPNLSLEDLSFSNQTLTLNARGTAEATLNFEPRIDLMLYGLAGPYIEPFSPYAQIKFDGGGLWTSDAGLEEEYGVCSQNGKVQNLCARIGVEGNVGLDAKTICGDKCAWDHQLYDTCSDYCSENPEFLCSKWCLDGDATPDPDPLTIRLEWTEGTTDLDLSLLSPVEVDYQDFEGNHDGGYQHGGDICPDESRDVPNCTDPAVDGRYTETIFVPEGEYVLTGPENVHEIEVKTYTAGQAGATFDLIVEVGGEEVQAWRGQTAAGHRESKTFSVTLP